MTDNTSDNKKKFKPAGKDDTPKIVCIDMRKLPVKGIEEKNSNSYSCIKSSELKEGMSIKALEGGKQAYINLKRIKKQDNRIKEDR